MDNDKRIEELKRYIGIVDTLMANACDDGAYRVYYERKEEFIRELQQLVKLKTRTGET